MEYLRQLAGLMSKPKPNPKKDVTQAIFCPQCHITESKADIVYVSAQGNFYCNPECAARFGETIDYVYDKRTKKSVRSV